MSVLSLKMKNQKFRKLVVWQKAVNFVSDIYELTNQSPDHEIYGLSSQLRRAATSIALNIVKAVELGPIQNLSVF